jgi:hypothetical protein
MKVKDFLKKVNPSVLDVPVMLLNVKTWEERKAWGLDFSDGYYKEMDNTVVTVNISSTGVYVMYR